MSCRNTDILGLLTSIFISHLCRRDMSKPGQYYEMAPLKRTTEKLILGLPDQGEVEEVKGMDTEESGKRKSKGKNHMAR